MRFKTVIVSVVVVTLAAIGLVFLHQGRSSLAAMHRLIVAHHGGDALALNATRENDATAKAVNAARTRIAALGANWNAEVAAKTSDIYAALQSAQTQIDVGTHRTKNIHYGADPAQTLDLFIPAGDFSELTTVLVYLHGDALAPSADNVGEWIARIGGIGVIARYRSGAELRWPAGAEDVRLLLQWVHANIEQHGGDPRLIVLMGNSTGATHIAEYLFDERQQLSDGLGISAAILSSGIFDASFGEDLNHYFEDAASATPLALIGHYSGDQVPLMLWSAQYDPPAVQAGMAELFAKLCRKHGECPVYEQLAGANHVSPVLSIGSVDTAASGALIRFYHAAVN